MSLLRRRKNAATDEAVDAATELSRLVMEHGDSVDSGQLVRALARSVVHVPTPGEPAEPQPRLQRLSDGEGPPLWVVEDEDGKHAFLFTTPRRLVEACGPITAVTIDFTTLLMGWPEDVDLVLDPGHPEALDVPVGLLRDVALEAAGVATATSLQPSPAGADARIPDVEPVQVLGVTREVAERFEEVQALYRAEVVNREAAPRPLLHLVVAMTPVEQDRLDEIMSTISAAMREVDPLPSALLPLQEGKQSSYQELADLVMAVDGPYWQRSP